MDSFSKEQQEIIRNIIEKTKLDSQDSIPVCLGDSILCDEFEKNSMLAISWEENFTSVYFHGASDVKFDEMYSKINEIILLFDCLEHSNLAVISQGGDVFNNAKTDVYRKSKVQKTGVGNNKGDYKKIKSTQQRKNRALEKIGVINSVEFAQKIKKIANAAIYPSYSLKKLCDNKFRTIEQKTLFWTRFVAVIALSTLLLSAFI